MKWKQRETEKPEDGVGVVGACRKWSQMVRKQGACLVCRVDDKTVFPAINEKRTVTNLDVLRRGARDDQFLSLFQQSGFYFVSLWCEKWLDEDSRVFLRQ